MNSGESTEAVNHEAVSKAVTRRWSDVECDKCSKPLGTNGRCLQCLYAYESVASEFLTDGEFSIDDPLVYLRDAIAFADGYEKGVLNRAHNTILEYRRDENDVDESGRDHS